MRLGEAFARGSGDGLLRLGAGEAGQVLPPAFVWWRDFAARYVATLCAHAAGAEGGPADAAVPTEVPVPDQADLDALVLTAPMMPGAEYLTAEVLRGLWAALGAAFATPWPPPGPVQSSSGAEPGLEPRRPRALPPRREPPRSRKRRSPSWRPTPPALGARPGRSTCRSARRLREYAGAAQPRAAAVAAAAGAARRRELRLAARPLVDVGRDLPPAALDARARPLALPARRAAARARRRRGARAGLVARAAARRGRRSRATVGDQRAVGARRWTRCSTSRWRSRSTASRSPPPRSRELLAGTDGLRCVRGRWVEVDRERLQPMLDALERRRARARSEGLTFAEAMRLLAGAGVTRRRRSRRDAAPTGRRWSPGPGWPRRCAALRSPDGARTRPRRRLQGDAAALPAGRRALAAPRSPARPRRLPRRRHGPRQDDPGARAAAGAEAAGREAERSRACSSCRRR